MDAENAAGATFKIADLYNLLESSRNLRRAQIQESITQNPANFTKIGPIDLSVAEVNGYPLPSPMKAITARAATDTQVEVALITNGLSDNAKQNAYPISVNDTINFGEAVGKSWLTWAAQPGKTMTLYVAINAEIKTGKLLSVSAGGVNISEGSIITTQAAGSVAITAGVLLAQDTSRISATIENQSGTPIYLGDSTVTLPGGAKPGITLLPGASLEWKNTAALYAIASIAVTSQIAINVES
jgi:hypothetical protein